MTNEINLIAIAEQFTSQGQVTSIESLGNGNINDTFLVTLDSSQRKHFVLQRINTQVFGQPELVMQNMRILTDHVSQKLKQTPANRRWEVPRVFLTQDNQDLWKDQNGGCWRAISFVENAQSFDTLPDNSHACEIGYALGMFHNLISDLPPAKLADTLPGFHITPVYLQQYEDILTTTHPQTSPEVNYCLQFVSTRNTFANILEDAKATGKLPLRLMHGDPKINNVLFDTTTQKAVSVIDLDTVKPGLVHYDIGDCLRSGCNPAGEETEDWEKVYFDTDLCQGILQGYLDIAQAFLTENDYTYIYAAIRLITFELGLRFFTDYLAGNVYFKIQHPEHNLARALVQFKLTESIEAQETKIRQIIADLK
ncbi:MULTISPECIES: phosphotransferase enzyme family protein [Cyanophyceae]|uniref:phosphotransferase enzyme family protein n=1 Tax=Cyanophyceae TaxID=3028117 RepID=UPI00232FD8C0|nr:MULTISPECIES: aminoglycoside phosphotransferase family protein [Cyanophyceae]MDB9356840.1 aminoglycoside phosphotransferase family protein [Nodularia spumigena CS-587/03]MDB9306752.1 aminoglycoside phosphotransferase family protein [Nodularia spumigena CS-591/12]MDB9319067.1 aminoglycoside phosphotransferase family protein [Nodularia spumigena CS-590/01A]MDB9324439.1 aminoglycoside phosphotransferase family protein [Nodularia spumigena CS-591/07A]MDB9324918.1 aminoglycoside phosphotransfera